MARYGRPLIALALTGTALSSLSMAHASTFAGTYRGVIVEVSARGDDRAQYDITIQATQHVASIPSEQSVYLTVRRCTSANKCKTIQHSKQALKDGEVSISPDMTQATVHTLIRGIRLDVTATTTYVDPATSTVTNPGVTLYGLETGDGGPNPRFDVNVISHAAVRFGTMSCSDVSAEMFSYQGIDQVGDDTRDPHTAVSPLPVALVKGRGKHCS